MISQQDLLLLYQLLDVSTVFPEQASKQLIKTAVEKQALPEVDFYYLLDVFKTEQNMHYLIDKKASEMLKALEQKDSSAI